MRTMHDLKEQILGFVENQQLKGYEIVITPNGGEMPRTFKFTRHHLWVDNNGPLLHQSVNEIASYPLYIDDCEIRGTLVFDGYILRAENGVIGEDGLPKWEYQDKEVVITNNFNHIPMPYDMFEVMKKTFELIDCHQPTHRYDQHRLRIPNRLSKITILAQYDVNIHLTESLNNRQVDLRLSARGTSLGEFVEKHYEAVTQNEQLLLTVGHHREPTFIPKPCINGEFIRNMELAKDGLKIHINFEIPLGVSDMMLAHIKSNEVEPLRKEVMEFQQEKYPNVEFHVHVVYI